MLGREAQLSVVRLEALAPGRLTKVVLDILKKIGAAYKYIKTIASSEKSVVLLAHSCRLQKNVIIKKHFLEKNFNKELFGYALFKDARTIRVLSSFADARILVIEYIQGELFSCTKENLRRIIRTCAYLHDVGIDNLTQVGLPTNDVVPDLCCSGNAFYPKNQAIMIGDTKIEHCLKQGPHFFMIDFENAQLAGSVWFDIFLFARYPGFSKIFCDELRAIIKFYCQLRRIPCSFYSNSSIERIFSQTIGAI
ncbi:hypothetical protein [Bartonella sp. DGB2]|uniref:hypothetical protein n=1 Tax=Bartonella sp. DGB2 TaxID=3388426 RepID=UPI0039903310